MIENDWQAIIVDDALACAMALQDYLYSELTEYERWIDGILQLCRTGK